MTGNSHVMLALDSNVFRNVKFIDYLILHKDKLNISLPVIVQLEVGYFYRLKGLSWADFKDEMSKFNCQFLDWQISQPKRLTNTPSSTAIRTATTSCANSIRKWNFSR